MNQFNHFLMQIKFIYLWLLDGLEATAYLRIISHNPPDTFLPDPDDVRLREHVPYFAPSTVKLYVKEDTPVGSIIFIAQLADNIVVTYQVSENLSLSSTQGLFIIERYSGVLRFNRTLDYEEKTFHRFVLYITQFNIINFDLQ